MTDRQKANDHAYFRLIELQEEQGGTPCQTNPEFFYPEDLVEPTIVETAQKAAKRLCASCPIKIQCQDYAIVTRQQYGIWGGLNPIDRLN